jgi:large conductance mechanosensitive channel
MKKRRVRSLVGKFFNEFKTFAVRGNMIDIAVGMIVGGAFTALVNSIITNIFTPLIGVLIGVDFSYWYVELPRLYGNAPPSRLNIGLFINSIISFIIITFVVFLFVKALNRLRSLKNEETEEDAENESSNDEILLTEIRDLLLEMRNAECGMRNDEDDDNNRSVQ